MGSRCRDWCVVPQCRIPQSGAYFRTEGLCVHQRSTSADRAVGSVASPGFARGAPIRSFPSHPRVLPPAARVLPRDKDSIPKNNLRAARPRPLQNRGYRDKFYRSPISKVEINCRRAARPIVPTHCLARPPRAVRRIYHAASCRPAANTISPRRVRPRPAVAAHRNRVDANCRRKRFEWDWQF